MKLWRNSKLDSILVILSVLQFIITLKLAFYWEGFSVLGKMGCFALITLMVTYNIIVISHLFTHVNWFESPFLNAIISMLNSINIAQSVQAYHLTHVRNHHLYNNDMIGPDGKTNDLTSTFQEGRGGDHANLFRYAFVGSISSIRNYLRDLLAVRKMWQISPKEYSVLNLVLAKSSGRRENEIRQIRCDRMVMFIAFCIYMIISWQWTIVCLLPAYYLAFSLVNVQNYYEHYGALPTNRNTDSVSYYGRFYNLLTFNDGYHQEHHLRPGTHWSLMPEVRKISFDIKNPVTRIISPVPAIIGFMDFKRSLLHKPDIQNGRAVNDAQENFETQGVAL